MPQQRTMGAARASSRGPASDERQVRPWEVVHACDHAREVADVVEAQLSVGMRPYLLTSTFPLRLNSGTGKVSLLEGWHDVRQWRRQLDESGAQSTPHLIHAHSFAAGMAAARGAACLVYDLRMSVDEQTSATAGEPPGSWLNRSFRTAEQFVLGRASAVVVHSAGKREECIARGVLAEDVFIVPDPFNETPSSSPALKQPADELSPILVNVAATRSVARDADKDSLGIGRLFAAFAELVREAETARLLLVGLGEGADLVMAKAAALNIQHAVLPVSASAESLAWAWNAAQIVIADPVILDDAPAAAAFSPGFAVTAMLRRKSVLAADHADNRELSREGRGLLWYSPDPARQARELAQRLAFLIRNPDFRRVLGENGRAHILQTRSPERVGRMYDEVYRHAYAKCRSGNPSQDKGGSLVPAQVRV